jgi:AcrR family transcriptional regulator
MSSENKPDHQAASPGRALTFIERARRAQIISCAIETIAAEGFDRASLARIAQRAEISAGVISYHFANKAELMAQVVEEVYSVGARFMTPQIEAQTDATSMLQVYIESNLAYIGANRSAIKAAGEIIRNLRAADGALCYDPAGDDLGLAGIERILRKGQEDGVFRAFDIRIMARSILGAIDTAATQLALDPALDSTHYAGELVTLFDHATRTDSDCAGQKG